MNNKIECIQRYINEKKKITEETLREWMAVEDLEIMGAVFQVFDQFGYLIDSYPDMKLIVSFYVNFFRRCIIENIRSEYVLSRYEAAGTLVNFYKGLKKDKKVPQRMLNIIKNMLKEVYIKGNEDIKECIVNGALEHLFEDNNIIKDFSDWKNKDILKKAYDDALMWINKRGDS